MIETIAFWTLFIVAGSLLIRELIPDPVKKRLKYERMLRQDRKSGKKGKYTLIFRDGIHQLTRRTK